MVKNEYLLALDIGGTWIKAAAVSVTEFEQFNKEKKTVALSSLFKKIEKLHFTFSGDSTTGDFLTVIRELIEKCTSKNACVVGIGISTSGVVNYHGTQIELTTPRLSILRKLNIKHLLESELSCPVVLINDNDAASIGMAELGYLKGVQTIGVMCIGTGLGFTIWKNGRRWRPDGNYPLPGDIYTPQGNYNELASASRLASLDENRNLVSVLSEPVYATAVKDYWKNLAGIIKSTTTIYALDKVCISGGLVEAALTAGCDMKKELHEAVKIQSCEAGDGLKIEIINEGNLLQLFGACLLTAAERNMPTQVERTVYKSSKTEQPYKPDTFLNEWSAEAIVQLLNDAEEEAGTQLGKVVDQVAMVATQVADALQSGGRLIYIGAGSSGRIAALDAVEIPCTFGSSKDQVIALIAGGSANAAVDIEGNFEEDGSSVPELLLLNIAPNDVVVGISASGTAFYVLSGLKFAHQRNAFTVLIQHDTPQARPAYCNEIIPLLSKAEVVAGSTRMKAGTATKKILNYITTTAMILCGRVHGSYMTNLKCLNQKLVLRAKSILQLLYQLSEEESAQLLQDCNYDLAKACNRAKALA
jgi:N-acetylmuramic acid 6-phosphate etherase